LQFNFIELTCIFPLAERTIGLRVALKYDLSFSLLHILYHYYTHVVISKIRVLTFPLMVRRQCTSQSSSTRNLEMSIYQCTQFESEFVFALYWKCQFSDLFHLNPRGISNLASNTRNAIHAVLNIPIRHQTGRSRTPCHVCVSCNTYVRDKVIVYIP
jgi:sensor histidine kinase YesM